jgi:hypothetical protein
MKSFNPVRQNLTNKRTFPLQQSPNGPLSQESRPLPVSSRDDMNILIEKRAYALYTERGLRHGYSLDDWLEAEREILNQILS